VPLSFKACFKLQVVFKDETSRLHAHGVKHLLDYLESFESVLISPSYTLRFSVNMCSLFGGLQDERRARSVTMPTLLSQEVNPLYHVNGIEEKTTYGQTSFRTAVLMLCLTRCLVKWLEVRCSCPMCNDNPISAALGQTHSPGNMLDELL